MRLAFRVFAVADDGSRVYVCPGPAPGRRRIHG
jgi:hypothetical protein